MSDIYMKELLRIAVAQICQTIGYNSTQAASLELMQDVLDKFLKEFTRDLHRQVEHYNRTEANLNDVTLTLSSINVNLNELVDYINNVEPVPFVVDVPKFPARKDSYLNFLKPGSKEVLTRPVHVHDHLPPMLPPDITASSPDNINGLTGGVELKAHEKLALDSSNISLTDANMCTDINGKIPNTVSLDSNALQSFFKSTAHLSEDGERAINNTREISSVVMTTGGYISPAIEGKMAEAIIPDIVEELIGLDAPPPPAPPAPPPPPPPSTLQQSTTSTTAVASGAQSNIRSSSRVALTSLSGSNSDNLDSINDKTQKSLANGSNSNSSIASGNKSKSHLLKTLDMLASRKIEMQNDFSNIVTKKNDKMMFGQVTTSGSQNKKPFLIPHGANNLHNSAQASFANMLLKKAKKQKAPPQLHGGMLMPDMKPALMEKKSGRLDVGEKAQRKYMKMLQKMAKQGKLPPDILQTLLGPDNKLKPTISPAIVAAMPPGPEKLQLEKLMRKQAKQRQKLLKQQQQEAQKSKKMQQSTAAALLSHHLTIPTFPPLLTPNSNSMQAGSANIHLESNEMSKDHPLENVPNLALLKATNLSSPAKQQQHQQQFLNQPGGNFAPGIPVGAEALTADNFSIAENAAQQSVSAEFRDAKAGVEMKLSNEPDRQKLNIFKKIPKQKNAKGSSPTPNTRLGINLADTPLINLPSGTTITPAPAGPLSTPDNRAVGDMNLITSTTGIGNDNVINVSEAMTGIGKMGSAAAVLNPNKANDLSMFNRVFGEKTAENVATIDGVAAVTTDLTNKPKKRGRKPGSKNAPKIPGVYPTNAAALKKSKKLKIDANIFPANFPNSIINPLVNPAAAILQTAGGHGFPNFAMFSLEEKQLQQQMMVMAASKERKERKKNKMLKNLPDSMLTNDAVMRNSASGSYGSGGPGSNIPTSEEVQSINKKLMRMDTILKPAPAHNNPNDMNMNSLLTGQQQQQSFPGIGGIPPAASPTSPLKAANSKRLPSAANDLNMPAAALASPFILPNRSGFPNLSANMLSMLQFPFPPRPGLIPTPGLFPTPSGLANFPNQGKMLPGIFPFPNLKQNSSTESVDLTVEGGNKKIAASPTPTNNERMYCNVAPLVPEFLKLTNPEALPGKSLDPANIQSSIGDSDAPKTPRSRQEKKISEPRTPETAGSLNKSLPTTPGGISLHTFEQLIKKNDSPLELVPLGKSSFGKTNLPLSMDLHHHTTDGLANSNKSCLDFSLHKKLTMLLNKAAPITLNADEPIEVSDDSDETTTTTTTGAGVTKSTLINTSSSTNLSAVPLTPTPPNNQQLFNMGDLLMANKGSSPTTPTGSLTIPTTENDLSVKELKKLKKQVRKTPAAYQTNTSTPLNLIGTDKSMENGGVGKLAGGADLIPLSSTGMAYSAKSIPLNSLTGNVTPTFGSHNKDLITGVSTCKNVFDNVTITPALNSTSSSYELQRKRKEHKKLKKLKEIKEGKIKKKKDKKDKTKNKEKSEKYLGELQPLQHQGAVPQLPVSSLSLSLSTQPKENRDTTDAAAIVITSTSSGEKLLREKEQLKRHKKDKKKEKQRLPEGVLNSSKDLMICGDSTVEVSDGKRPKATAITLVPKSSELDPSSINSSIIATSNGSGSSTVVPKLTLKLGGALQSPTLPPDETTVKQHSPAIKEKETREPSPELARISPLVTRPPKQKLNAGAELGGGSTTAGNNKLVNTSSTLEGTFGEVNKNNASSNVSMLVPPPSPWVAGGTISASSVLLPHQLLQTSKPHDSVGGSATNASNTSTDANNRHNISNTSDRQSPLTLITEASRPSSYIDAEGNRVWICPACGKVDDGSPMIGCDGCDAWYHWVCVGIFVAPKDNEDWFCRVCITKKKGLHGSDKKRKRTKKK